MIIMIIMTIMIIMNNDNNIINKHNKVNINDRTTRTRTIRTTTAQQQLVYLQATCCVNRRGNNEKCPQLLNNRKYLIIKLLKKYSLNIFDDKSKYGGPKFDQNPTY